MAGTVESSIVLNAVDNTKSALNSVQSNLEKLVHKAVEVSNGFSKIGTEGMSGFQLQTTKALNEVNRLTKYLSECTEGTQEYTIILNRLNSARERYNQLFEESDEATRQDIQAQLEEAEATRQAVIEEENQVSALEKLGNFLSENVQKLFQHKEKVMGNKEAMKYWEDQIKRVENELSQAATQLSNMENNVNTSSDELQKQKEYVRELEQQLKEYKKELKDTTANMSPFQLALQKLGKNIKSLFLLQTAKNILSGVKKAFKWAVDEMIEGGMKLEAVSGNFDHLAEVAGMDAIKLRNALREASHNMISDADLMASANKAMMLGVGGSVENLSDLMKIAEVRGAQMGQSATKAFDDMVLGIGRLSPKILDNLGIIVNLNDAYTSYAEKIGKSTDELTKQEQQVAVTEEVIRKSQDQLLNRENRHLSVQEKLTQIVTKVKNALDMVGAQIMSWLSPVIDKVNELATNIMKKSDDVTKDIKAKSNKIPTEIAKGVEDIWRICETLVTDLFDLAKFIWDDILTPTREIIERIIGWIVDGVNYLGEFISSIFGGISDEENEMITGFAGDWTDLLYILRQGLEGIYTATKVVLKGIVGLVKALGSNIGTIVGYIPTFFSAAWKGVKLAAKSALQGVLDTIYDWVNKTIEGVNKVLDFFGLADKAFEEFTAPQLFGDLDSEADELLNKVKEFEGIGEQLAEPRKEAWNDVNAEVDAGISRMLDNYLTRVGDIEKRKYAVNNGNSPRKIIRNNDDDTGGGGGSGSNKQTEEEKQRIQEIKDQYKVLQDYLKDAQKEYEESIKKYDELWDKAEKKIEENEKEIEKLQKEIEKLEEELEKLNKQLDELYSGRTTSIGDSLLGSQDVLDKFYYQLGESRDALEDMKDIAKELSYQDLKILEWKDEEEYMGYAVKDLKELKQALDNISDFEGIKDTKGIENMKDLIEQARERENMSDIASIEKEFETKRDEINGQIAEIQAQIDDKQAKIVNLETQIMLIQEAEAKVLEKWAGEIMDAMKKYGEAAEEKLEYERQHQTELDLTYVKLNKNTQEIQEQERLMRKMLEEWREMHNGGGSSHRAGGGVVYGGNSYIVGEHGPELFTPNVSGKIIPNNQITNNNGIEININGAVVRNDGDIQAIADEIIRQIKLEKNFGIN